MFDILDAIQFLTLTVSLWLAFFIRKNNKHSKNNKYFAYYVHSTAFWVATLLLYEHSNQDWVYIIGKINFAAVLIMAYFAFRFGYYFPSKTFNIKTVYLWLIRLAFTLVIYITIFTKLVAKDEVITKDGIETQFGDFYFFYIAFFIIFVSTIVVFPLLKFKKVSPKERQQIKYLTLGTSLSLIWGIATNAIFPFFFSNYTLQNLGPMSIFFLFGFTAYAILKYRLLDIRVVIQLSLVYTFLLSVVTGVFLAINFVIGFIFHLRTETYAISALITTFIGIFGVPPLQKYFQKKTDKFFFKHKYDYSEAMATLSKTLNKNIDLEKLIVEIIDDIQAIIKPTTTMIWLKEQKIIIDNSQKITAVDNKNFPALLQIAQKDFSGLVLDSDIDVSIKKNEEQGKKSFPLDLKNFLRENNFSLALSLRSADKFVGIIFLGKKLSEEEFSNEDIKLLSTFSHQAAVAIEKSQLYDKEIHYSENLEKEVDKRTKKIKRLQEKQKNLMVDVSHNLQTPLTIIRCELEQLQTEFPKNENLKNFEKSIDKLSHFIYDLLRFSQLDSGKIKLNKTKYDLSQQINDLSEYYQIMFDEKNIKIITDIEKNVFIKGDIDKIEETITNIMSNAYKYIGENKQVKMSVKKTPKHCTISIKDNGPGIHPEDLKKIFNRFFRSEAPDGTKGNGLGLSFCKKIIELHHGAIKAKSKINQGTIFTITLPRA